MVTIESILSEAQASFNDFGWERFKEGELVDMINHTLTELARDTEVWISRRTIVPNASAVPWVSTDTYQVGQIVRNNDIYWYATVINSNSTPADDNANWTRVLTHDITLQTTYSSGDIVWTAGPNFYVALQDVPIDIEITDDVYWRKLKGLDDDVYVGIIPYTDEDGDTLSPYKIIAVYKQGGDGTALRPLKEYTVQTIASTHNGYSFFTNNEKVLGHSTHFLNTNRTVPAVDGSLAIVSATPFDVNERLVVDYIQGKPLQALTWDQQASKTTDMNIPDFMAEACKYGLLWRLAETAFIKGDNNYGTRAQRLQQIYDQYKAKAITYAKKFKNKTGTLVAQPHQFLKDINPTFGRI